MLIGQLAFGQGDFSWHINIGALQHLNLPAQNTAKTVYFDNGSQADLILEPKKNPYLFNAVKGNTGSRKLHCNSPLGFSAEVLFGVNDPVGGTGFDAGISLSHQVTKNFYWSGNAQAPHFNQTFRNTTIGLPVRFKALMGVEYDLFFYLKYQLDYTLQYSYREQFDCQTFEQKLEFNDEFRRFQHGFGAGFNLGFLYAEADYYPWFPLKKGYQNGAAGPFQNLRNNQVYFRYGLSLNNRSACIFGKMLATPDFKGWGFVPVLYQPGRWVVKGKHDPFQTTLNGAPLDVDDHCSECKPTLFRWWIPSMGLYAAFNDGGIGCLLIGAEHSRYSSDQYAFVFENQQKRYITYRRFNDSHAVGLSSKLEMGPFILGAKLDWIYRYKRVEYYADEKFSQYAKLDAPELKRFIPSVSLGFGNLRFFFAEFQYFPVSFVKPEYYDQFGVRTIGKAPGAYAIRIGINPAFIFDYINDFDCY